MATTFAPATTTTSTNNSAANEIRASISINTHRVPLVSAQTTNCEQAISTSPPTTTTPTKQSYLDHTSFKNEKRQPSYKNSSVVEQFTNRLENRFNTESIATTTIYSSAKTTTATATATTASLPSSLNNGKNNGRNLTLSNTKSNQAHNSSQVRSSSCQVDKNQTVNLINQASAIKTASSCSNNTPLSSISISLSLSSSSSSSSLSSPSTLSSSSSSSTSSSSSSLAPSNQAHNPPGNSFQSQNQNQNYQLQYQEEFYKMRERLFRMLSKVPIQVETEPSVSWQQHYSRKLDSSPVHLTGSASTSISTPNSAAASTSAASSICSSSRSGSSRKIDQEALIIKYYNDKSLNDILDQHFGCALINHNIVLGLTFDSQQQQQQQQQPQQPQQQQQQQQNLHFLDNSGGIINSGNVSNFVADQHHQSMYCMSTTDNEIYRESLSQQQHPFDPVEPCLDWPNSNSNSYNLSLQMAVQHGSFELTIPSVQNKTPNTKRLTNQKRSTINTVKDHHKYAPNTNQNQRQPTKRQRLSNSARQHKNIAPSSNMPMSSVRATSGQAKNVRELHTTSNGRNLPLLVEYQQPFKQKKIEMKEEDEEVGEEEEEQILLMRPINGKPSKYDESVSCATQRIDSDQHILFGNNFLVSRPLVSSQTGLSNQETRINRSQLDSQPISLTDSYTTAQPNQAQQQLLNHHSNNHITIQGSQQNELPHNLYHNNPPPNYLQHQDQVSMLNCIEPHQSSHHHHHQLGQHFELREPSSCYGISPQVVDQQQQFLTDNSPYYQPQTTYLQVEPQSEWQCHSQHSHHVPPVPPHHTQQQHLHLQQHSSNSLDDISQQQQQQQQQQQHMIDQHQPHDGLFSESYPVRRHNFNSQNPPYHLPEPVNTYSLIYQSDCNTTQLNLNPTNNNNPGQQLLSIDETSQHLNHSIGQLSGLLN